MSLDDRLRALERRAAADPSDDDARLALAVARLRGGDREAARAVLAPATAAGYRLLCERAGSDASLLALLDEAPEWRSSGGDPGCSRWSSAEPVTGPPRTLWRRRIEEVHAALGVAVDRGRAFFVTLGPRGTEVVALSVFTGETLWRHALGRGAPAAPLAREGWVFAAVVEERTLRTVALSADGAVVWRTEDPCEPGSLPGALNVFEGQVVLPLATTWRGSSRVPDGRSRAAIVAHDASGGRLLWTEPAEQVFSEAPVQGTRLFVLRDFVTGSGSIQAREAHGEWLRMQNLDAVPHFLAFKCGAAASALGGILRAHWQDERDIEQWSSLGGAITSLAIDGGRVLVGRGAEFAVKAAAPGGATIASWQTHESPLPFRPRGVAHPPPSPRSAVCAGDACYLASPLAPSLAAYSVKTGAVLWRHEVEGLLVPEEGPRFTWPTSEAGPPDRGPLYLAPLPGCVLGVTLSGYVFLVG